MMERHRPRNRIQSMAADKHQRTGPHDLGGEDSGPIPLASNDPAWWEKRIDAVFKLLGDEKRQILRVDELRRGIETLGDDAYARLSYYERSTVDRKSVV